MWLLSTQFIMLISAAIIASLTFLTNYVRFLNAILLVKVKVIPQQAWKDPRGSGSVMAPDFLDVRHYKGGRSSAIRTAAGEIPGTHFQGLSRPQGTWFRRSHGKKSPATPPGIDPETVRLVAQCLNHYATPGPDFSSYADQLTVRQLPHSVRKEVKLRIQTEDLSLLGWWACRLVNSYRRFGGPAFLRSVGNYLPVDAAWHLAGFVSWATLLRESQIVQDADGRNDFCSEKCQGL